MIQAEYEQKRVEAIDTIRDLIHVTTDINELYYLIGAAKLLNDLGNLLDGKV